MLCQAKRIRTPASAALLVLGLALGAAAGLSPAPAAASGPAHGLSTFGELNYKADFQHFDWVNPQAPRGGRLALIGTLARTTFDSFNGYILKGDAAQGIELLFDALMVSSGDEPDAVYGLVAHAAELAPDRSAVVFHMRPEARFADGSAVTADDVVFSLDMLKTRGHPAIASQLADVVKAEAIDAHTVRFSFSAVMSRDLPRVVATLPIFSKAYYATRAFDQTTLEPPLGSGPYKIADFKVGTHVTYKRRDDYWARDLPVNRGRYNFDEVRYDYFRDRAAGLLALLAGEIDLREEFTARDWMTAYDVPAVKSGRLIKLVLPDNTPSGTQGYFLNTRRSKLADPRVGRALDYAFDFEFANKTLFYGLYARTTSFFENSSMKAVVKPSEPEIALLEPFRSALPPEALGEAYVPPVSDGTGKDRRRLQEADRLLKEAGWQIKDAKRVNAKGEVLDLEFLFVDPTSERILTGYAESLKRLGLAISLRRVDPAQYERRVKSFDFDVVGARYALRLTPGLELRSLWSSQAAKTGGSLNLSGVSHPAIDALIGKVTAAQSRHELETATRALDRVLRASHFWVPQWYRPYYYVVHWDKFGRPATQPRFARGIIDSWWYDAEKAAKLKAN
jgi:microcin C transport system substrate-binding protein